MTGMDQFMIVVGLVIFAIGITAVFLLIGALVPNGDERKKFIKMHAMSYTFVIIIVMKLIDVAVHLYNGLFTTNNISSNGNNPIIELSVIAVIFLLVLFTTKRKFGD